MIHGEPNPELLVLARQSRGLPAGAVAEELKERTGLKSAPTGLLSKWENGAATPSVGHLTELAAILDYPVSLFYQPERLRGSDSVCLHHRKRASMPARLLTKIEAKMHLSQLRVKRLLSEISIETSRSFLTLDPTDHDGPAGVARTLRGYWHLPSGPIANLVRLVESAGGVTLIEPFGTRKLDGMSCWAKASPPLFYLNSEMPMDRMRWTIAHELGHLIMHATPPDEDPEGQADRFALEFLAPMDELAYDLRGLTFQKLPALKSYWKISMVALVRAAETLDVIPPNKARSLYVQLSRRGWREREPYELDPETPTVVRDAVRLHLDQHGYEPAELAAIVNLLPEEFDSLYMPDAPSSDKRLRVVG